MDKLHKQDGGYFTTILDLQKTADNPSYDEPTTEIVDTIPEGLDIDKFNRGVNFFKRNLFCCLRGMFYSLIYGLSIDRFLNVLVATGRTSTPADAFYRYRDTKLHVLKWHYGHIWNKDSSARKSILYVRMKHLMARRYVEGVAESQIRGDTTNLRDGNILDTDNSNSIHQGSQPSQKVPVYFSQYDMSLVQAGFIASIILDPYHLGIKCSDSDLDDFVYVWGWIGHLMGIDEQNNICVGGYIQAYKYCEAIQKELVLPSLKNPPRHFEEMANCVLEGRARMSRTPIAYKLRVMVAIAFIATGNPVPFKLTITEHLRVVVERLITFAVLYVPGVLRLLNFILERSFGCDEMT